MEINNRRWMRTGLALACSLAMVFSVLPARADDDIESLENQTSALESELAGINQEILTLSEEISTTEMQVEILNGEIERTADSLAEAESNEEKQYEDMKARIKFMYENGNATLLEMLFSAEDMTDFLNKADFIENLSEYDRKALDQLTEVHDEIAFQKSSLEAEQASLTELQSSLEAQKAELQAKASETSTNLDEVNARLQAARDEAARIAAEEAASSTVSGGGSVTTGGSIDASSSEVTLLAALLDCEAVHDYDCMLAVATVVMNRVESPRFGNSITEVIYAKGQFSPVWTGKLDRVLNSGPSSLAQQVAQDAINGARHMDVINCYYFLYAPSTNRNGIEIGNNLFFTNW